MDLDALTGCLASSACLVTQTTSGLIIGMLLFLVAVGLTLIFGVLKVVNFSHGAFYMFGAYFAMTAYQLTGSFALAMLCGAAGTALLGLIFERVFMSRVYGRDVLMQLLVCYAFVLIFDDVVRMIWGPEFKSMGMPAAFQVPPLFIAGGVVPPYYLLLIGVALVAAIILGLGLARTRIGKVIRAAAHNPGMVSALGINTGLIYGGVFALGGMLAGLAGALAAPVRSLTPGMGFSVLIESFIVTVIGGMGSILGALVGALLIGLIRSLRLARLSPVHRRPDVPVHGDRAGVPADRPVRQGGRMTELQAEQVRKALDVSAPGEAAPQSGCADCACGLCRAGAAADAHQQQIPARLRHPLRGLWAVRDVAQPAGRLHRPDVVRPRHVLRPRRLRLWPDDAEDRRVRPGGVRRDAG